MLSMIGYGVQITLLAHISRKMDSLDIGFYRNASFLITLLPLLFLTSFEEILVVKDHLPELAGMAFAAVASIWGGYYAFKFLPVGIALSVRRVMTIFFIFLMGLFFFGETLSVSEIVLVLIAISGVIYLGIQKNHMSHLDSRVLLGFTWLIITAIPSAITYYMVANLARDINPLVAGYFWEISIALAIGFTLIVRYLVTGKKFKWIGFKRAGKIALASSPTLFGTGAYALAVSVGPIVIVSSIGLGLVPGAALLSHYVYHEKLNRQQWMGILLTLVAICALKFV